MDGTEKLKFKMVILGDASVGKTSLVHHFCEGFFRESYLSTIGVAFLTKTIDLEYDGRSVNIVLQLWDIGGQSIFQSIRKNYLKGAQSAFILWDVTNRSSLLHIDGWIAELRGALNVKDLTKVPILVIGNKIDLNHDERLKEKANEFLKNQFKIPIATTYASAKTGEGMVEAFKSITKAMMDLIYRGK